MSIKLPPQDLRFMNESDEQFISIGTTNLSILEDHGFTITSKVLDVGCGYGRLAFAINHQYPDFSGQYVGLDILKKHIGWCNKAFKGKKSKYLFQPIDIMNDRYNAEGVINAEEYRFEHNDASFDHVTLFSVFTHMYEPDIDNYLKEICRVLCNKGICVATFFTYDDELLAKINLRNAGITLNHSLNKHTRYFNENDPLHAIAFDREYLKDKISDLGFEILSIEGGHWAGGNSIHYQDVFVLEKP